jgi:F-type H+-transporting ATPase subunit c
MNESLLILLGVISGVSIFTAGITIAIGAIAPSLGEGKAVAQ